MLEEGCRGLASRILPVSLPGRYTSRSGRSNEPGGISYVSFQSFLSSLTTGEWRYPFLSLARSPSPPIAPIIFGTFTYRLCVSSAVVAMSHSPLSASRGHRSYYPWPVRFQQHPSLYPIMCRYNILGVCIACTSHITATFKLIPTLFIYTPLRRGCMSGFRFTYAYGLSTPTFHPISTLFLFHGFAFTGATSIESITTALFLHRTVYACHLSNPYDHAHHGHHLESPQ
ncbi:hypothetical protein ARMGADRAFT_77405 [Armillaria gallica]|uniref:Uncharacterized protein n=1 Tax=Armillaria gallica TaxID=47427 RepID=A0A2H3CMI4_ARMGA|nr:hypothetical protein ARMGADRAFT_77405 [Armillaria gallica]